MTLRRLNILIVDDSNFTRLMTNNILTRMDEVAEVWDAPDGETALALLAEHDVDMVLLDLNMEGMDGIATLKAIRAKFSNVGVLMMSAVEENIEGEDAQRLATTLEMGALDFVPKIGSGTTQNHDILTARLTQYFRSYATRETLKKPQTSTALMLPSRLGAIVMAGNSGSLQGILYSLKHLPAKLPVPICVSHSVQANFMAALLPQLRTQIPHPVSIVEDRMLLEPGNIYLAHGNTPMRALLPELGGEHARIEPCTLQEDGQGAADRLFESTAQACKEPVVGIVLSGLGTDGTNGLRAIRERKGICLIQKPHTCGCPDMPASAQEAGLVDRALPWRSIPGELRQMFL